MTSIFALSSNLHPFPTIDPAVWMIWLAAILSGFFLFQSSISHAGQNLPCRINITSKDAVLVADPDGRILYEKNQAKRLVPASTIKILTALAALNHFGPTYRFPR
ncbi:MAG: D-alanyl-D-alanine carboxypeptidase [Deltaproteobacteria bacterium]|nr:D-alanyl-D-alanine carboxypeptidase [Deltaproteobacteria bacterium]